MPSCLDAQSQRVLQVLKGSERRSFRCIDPQGSCSRLSFAPNQLRLTGGGKNESTAEGEPEGDREKEMHGMKIKNKKKEKRDKGEMVGMRKKEREGGRRRRGEEFKGGK